MSTIFSLFNVCNYDKLIILIKFVESILVCLHYNYCLSTKNYKTKYIDSSVINQFAWYVQHNKNSKVILFLWHQNITNKR